MTEPRRIRERTRRVRASRTVSKTREKKSSGEVTELEESIVKEPVDIGDLLNPGYVKIGAGITKNVGDYNFIRVDVSISMPCEPNQEGYDEAYEETTKLVDKHRGGKES